MGGNQGNRRKSRKLEGIGEIERNRGNMRCAGENEGIGGTQGKRRK